VENHRPDVEDLALLETWSGASCGALPNLAPVVVEREEKQPNPVNYEASIWRHDGV
jgi:hypothetical protein